MNSVSFKPIGIIHTPFKERKGIPRQAIGAQEIEAVIELLPEFTEGLSDLGGFSHITVLFYLHLIEDCNLQANPPWDDKAHGVFSTCSPFRPNPIGISVVKLDRIENNKLYINGVDMADQTPVLDIKPYIPDLFPQKHIQVGWMNNKVNGMIKSKSGDRQN